jgi:hypothetical protein
MDPSWPTKHDEREVPFAIPVLALWTRGILLALAVGLTGVLGVAIWLRPYDEQSKPLTMETHRQLGLPPCTFLWATGYPCPACGMTTSFALLMHGDVVSSLRANWVGTIAAALGLFAIPWSVASLCYGRTLFVRSLERTFTIVAIIMMAALVLRWCFVVWLIHSRGGPSPF